MDTELAIYVSASPEMDPECELVGKMLANLPSSIGWVIKRTPVPPASANPDIGALGASQFYLLLMRTDVMAPVGVELDAAKRARLVTFAYRDASSMVTPAAAFFVRNAGVAWQQYQTAEEFISSFERSLISRLIAGTPGYGLALPALQELSSRLREMEESTSDAQSDERRGAGRGGVILPVA